MAKRREQQEDMENTKRISPYQEMDQAREGDVQDEYMDEYADDYTEPYEHEYADEYDGYEDEEEQAAGPLGFFSTLVGKIVAGVIVLLLVVLIALLAMRFLGKSDETQELPAAEVTPTPVAEQPMMTASVPVIFAPVVEETPEPTAQPTATPTTEPTATPLPIILTNTPTPTPTATPTPTPTATPEPTPTPTPAPTAVPEIGRGEVNRDANLRESAASNGKVKQTIERGEVVTIHESLTDKSGKVWYNLTVDDQAVTGFMRDYVVDLDGKLVEIEAEETPKNVEPEEAEAAEGDIEAEEEPAEETAEAETEEVIAEGKTNRDANLRKSMNGTVLGTVKAGKSVRIFEGLKDKNGNIWYRLKITGDGTTGYMRDFVIELDEEIELDFETEVSKGSVGTAKTNRRANVRTTPDSGGKVARQISKGVKLYIMGKYSDSYGQIWYQVSTESGNTTGYMRDYVLDNVKLDEGVQTQTYSE